MFIEQWINEVHRPYVQALKAPVILAIVNAFIVQLAGLGESFSWFHTGLIVAMFWAGWRSNRQTWGNWKYAAMAGPIIFFIGLVVIGGTLQVLFSDFTAASQAAQGSWAEHLPRLAYLLGLVIATVLVSPICLLISLVGGVLAEYF